MTHSYSSRSFRTLIILAVMFGFLTTGCKKSGGTDPEIDLRDQYVGTYKGTYRNTIYVVADILGDPKSGDATVTVTKGSNANEIYIELVNANDRSLKVTAELNGVNFTVIDKNTDSIPISATRPVDSDYTASGVFDPNSKKFSYASVANALRNGAQYKQTYEIVCTKQ